MRRIHPHVVWLIAGAFAAVALTVAHTQSNPNAPPPRTSDGKPDLSGVWRPVSGTYRRNLAADAGDLPFQPAAATLFKQRQRGNGNGNPAARCLPRGVPAVMLVREYPWKIVQTPAALVILFDESLHYRQVLTDGRGFPEDAPPTWLGYSIGRWEGDTFVAETIGVIDETWLDDIGHPHSNAMHVVERFRRRTVSMMDMAITIDDRQAYTKPWTANVRFELLPDSDFDEHLCGAG